MTATTHNPSEEPCWVSRLRENFTSGSYGEELETGPAARSGTAPVPYPTNHVRQSQDQGLRAGGHAPDRPRQTLHLARAARLRRGAHRQNRRRHGALASHSCQKAWPPRAFAVRSRPPHAAQNLCRSKSRSNNRLPRPTPVPKTPRQTLANFGLSIASRVRWAACLLAASASRRRSASREIDLMDA